MNGITAGFTCGDGRNGDSEMNPAEAQGRGERGEVRGLRPCRGMLKPVVMFASAAPRLCGRHSLLRLELSSQLCSSFAVRGSILPIPYDRPHLRHQHRDS